MPFEHSRLDTSERLITLVDNSGGRHHYTPAQFREYVSHDRALRAGRVAATHVILPGGYDLFAQLWGADATCPYQFSSRNASTNTITVRGAPVPTALLNELDPPLTPAPPSAPPEPQFSEQRMRTIEHMLWGTAEREARFYERRSNQQEKRTDNRRRKRAEHRVSDRTRSAPSKEVLAPPIINTSSGGIAVASGSGASGSDPTALAAPVAGGTSSLGVGGALQTVPNRTASAAGRRESSPMEEDKDAEGEPDELIEYSDPEEAGGASQRRSSRAGKKRA
ncbi:hypothetical protein BD311DRAFT_781943 [Dichomitus squalens]|uniref:Uncharacterized protein n=1 Tax=Dichomitus squalens TaxID=114155 RepID=A0A4Q9MAW6_9APHY|nr:hypothetical protein BD311DRAFT_781943 [Dichomitus squalens]